MGSCEAQFLYSHCSLNFFSFDQRKKVLELRKRLQSYIFDSICHLLQSNTFWERTWGIEVFLFPFPSLLLPTQLSQSTWERHIDSKRSSNCVSSISGGSAGTTSFKQTKYMAFPYFSWSLSSRQHFLSRRRHPRQTFQKKWYCLVKSPWILFYVFHCNCTWNINACKYDRQKSLDLSWGWLQSRNHGILQYTPLIWTTSSSRLTLLSNM